MIEVEIANPHEFGDLEPERLASAVRRVLEDAGIERGEISLAILDDAAIRELNRRYLDHDEATDVLSFLLDRQGADLEGEIVVSADTAARSAAAYGWNAADEVLLYVIHGALHLVGHDDDVPELRLKMQDSERRYLALFGLARRDETGPAGDGP